MANPQRRSFYGRRHSRPLGKERSGALDTLLPALAIPENLLGEDGRLDPSSLYEKVFKQYVLEIGFGSGERLAALMSREPDCGYIGAEPFVNGMSAFLKSIKDNADGNIRVLMDDAMLLVRALKDRSLDRIYILNPDPWPKTRHHKRRIVQKKNLDEFARVLKPGGALIMSTDVPGLAGWMVRETFTHPAFEWTANSAEDWRNAPANWIKTRYEEKGAKGAERMTYLLFHTKCP